MHDVRRMRMYTVYSTAEHFADIVCEHIHTHSGHATNVKCMNESRIVITSKTECKLERAYVGLWQSGMHQHNERPNFVRPKHSHCETSICARARYVCMYTVFGCDVCSWSFVCSTMRLALLLTLWLFRTRFGVHQLLVLCVTVNTHNFSIRSLLFAVPTFVQRNKKITKIQRTNERISVARSSSVCIRDSHCRVFLHFDSWIRLPYTDNCSIGEWRIAIEYSVKTRIELPNLPMPHTNLSKEKIQRDRRRLNALKCAEREERVFVRRHRCGFGQLTHWQKQTKIYSVIEHGRCSSLAFSTIAAPTA